MHAAGNAPNTATALATDDPAMSMRVAQANTSTDADTTTGHTTVTRARFV